MNQNLIKINNNYIIILIGIILFLTYLYLSEKYDSLYNKINNLDEENNIIKKKLNEKINVIDNNNEINNKLNELLETRTEGTTPNDNNTINERDYNAIYNPLAPPLKRNYHFNEPSKMRINIETRPSGGSYQQIGMLHKKTNSDVDMNTPGSNNDSYVIPLFGKPVYKGSTKWLYYTNYNNIKIPIRVNNVDCTDDSGCNEMNDNESIDIDELNGSFNVKIYKFDKPRYIPYV